MKFLKRGRVIDIFNDDFNVKHIIVKILFKRYERVSIGKISVGDKVELFPCGFRKI